MHKLRKANLKDYKKISEFIDKFWKKKHILSTNKKLFNYYYKQKKNYSFYLFLVDNKINSIIGYFVNKKNNKHLYGWLSLWVSVPQSQIFGIQLLKKLEKIFNKNIIVSGLSEKAVNILKLLNYKIYTLNHFYLANDKLHKFKIIKNPIIKVKYIYREINFEELHTKRDIQNKSKNLNSKYKDANFFIKKYYKNLYYNYNFFILNDKLSNKSLLLVVRKININNSTILRIIDYLGEEKIFMYSRYFMNILMYANSAEYIDFLNYGTNKKYLFKSGFSILDYDKTTLPNYFEPFLKKNKKIYIAHNNEKFFKNVVVCKGDGDQERPNNLNCDY